MGRLGIPLMGSRSTGAWLLECVWVCTCARESYSFLPTMAVGRIRLRGPAKEGITFWFSRLNAEVSVY